MIKDPVSGRDIRNVPFSKEDNSELYSALRKSYLKLGSHKPNQCEKKEPVSLEADKLRQKAYEKNRFMGHQSHAKIANNLNIKEKLNGTSHYNASFIWKTPKFDY